MARYRHLSAIESSVLDNATRNKSIQPNMVEQTQTYDDSPIAATEPTELITPYNYEPKETSPEPSFMKNKPMNGGKSTMNRPAKPGIFPPFGNNHHTNNYSSQSSNPSPNYPQQQSSQNNRPQFPAPYPAQGNGKNKRINPNNNSNNKTGDNPGIFNTILTRLRETPPHELINTGCQNAINVCTNIQSLATNMNVVLQSLESMWPVAKTLLSSYGSTLLSKEGTAPTSNTPTQESTQSTHTQPPKPAASPSNPTNSYDKTYSANYTPKESGAVPQYNIETHEEYIPLYRRTGTTGHTINKPIIETAAVPPQPKTPPTQTPPSPPSNSTPNHSSAQPSSSAHSSAQPPNQESPGMSQGPARMPSPEDIQQLMSNPLVQNVLSSLMQPKK